MTLPTRSSRVLHTYRLSQKYAHTSARQPGGRTQSLKEPRKTGTKNNERINGGEMCGWLRNPAGPGSASGKDTLQRARQPKKVTTQLSRHRTVGAGAIIRQL